MLPRLHMTFKAVKQQHCDSLSKAKFIHELLVLHADRADRVVDTRSSREEKRRVLFLKVLN